MKITCHTDDLLTIQEATKRLGITRVTLYRWIKKGKIGAMTFGGYRAIPASEVERIESGGSRGD